MLLIAVVLVCLLLKVYHFIQGLFLSSAFCSFEYRMTLLPRLKLTFMVLPYWPLGNRQGIKMPTSLEDNFPQVWLSIAWGLGPRLKQNPSNTDDKTLGGSKKLKLQHTKPDNWLWFGTHLRRYVHGLCLLDFSLPCICA